MVAAGTPEQVVRDRKSYTAQALAKVLRNGERTHIVSRYRQTTARFRGLKTIPIAGRAAARCGSSDFATPYEKGAGIAGWLDSLPHILAADSFARLVDAIRAARATAASRCSGAWAGTSSSAAWRRC